MQRQFRLGGGVAPKTTRLRGQSIIEYVLIAAIIGLVVVFAGPQVSGAIRNQFSQVTNTIDSGTDGDSFISAEEKAYREAMKTIVNKEAKDWTLDEQKAAATDIAKNGTSSVVYAKAKAAMDARTTWSVKLTNGQTMTYRIIGINHDDLSDGSGKAGLTYLTVYGLGNYSMNVSDSNFGGWEKSELRAKMNSGEIWNLMPADFQSKLKTVRKLTNNADSATEVKVTTTSDRLFLLSYSEVIDNKIWGFPAAEGNQYQYFKTSGAEFGYLSGGAWGRSKSAYQEKMFFYFDNSKIPRGWSAGASMKNSVCPAFCF